MKIKELIEKLNKITDKEQEIKISSDEELNGIYSEFEVSEFDEGGYIIFPFGDVE